MALSAEALYDEGMRYLNGNGVKKNMKKAIDCFEQSIAIGSSESKRELGLILLGDGLLHTDAADFSGYRLNLNAIKEGNCCWKKKQQKVIFLQRNGL